MRKKSLNTKKICTECARNVSLDKFSKQILTFDGGAKKTEYHRDFEYLERNYICHDNWNLQNNHTCGITIVFPNDQSISLQK